jgi:hypothetical protein
MSVLAKTNMKLHRCSPWLYKGQPDLEKQKRVKITQAEE